MAVFERSRRIRRTKSLSPQIKLKTSPLSPKSVVIIEAEKIIKRDGFRYFMIANE